MFIPINVRPIFNLFLISLIFILPIIIPLYFNLYFCEVPNVFGCPSVHPSVRSSVTKKLFLKSFVLRSRSKFYFEVKQG